MPVRPVELKESYMNKETLPRRIYNALYFHPETPSFWLGILMAVLLFLGRKKRHGTARAAAAWVGTLGGVGGSVLAAFEFAQENGGSLGIPAIIKLSGKTLSPNGEVVSLRVRIIYLLKHLLFLLVAIRIFNGQLKDARLAAAS